MQFESSVMKIGEVLGKSFNLYWSNFLLFALPSIATQALIYLLAKIQVDLLLPWYIGLYESGMPLNQVQLVATLVSTGGSVVYSVLFSAILHCLITYFASQKLLDKKVEAREFFSRFLPRFPGVIGISLLQVLIVLIAVLPVALIVALTKDTGFLAVIIMLAAMVAMVVFMIRYSLSPIAYVIERIGVIGAFKRSATLTSSARGRIFGLYMVYAAAALIISLLFNSTSQYGTDTGKDLLNISLSGALTPLLSCGLTLVYFNMRGVKEGFALEQLVEGFSEGGPLERQDP
jgi:hypothetical protein